MLGFSVDDSKSNFQLRLKLAQAPDFDALADLMLSALYEAYGARRASHLIVNSPAVAQGDSLLPANDCPFIG